MIKSVYDYELRIYLLEQSLGLLVSNQLRLSSAIERLDRVMVKLESRLSEYESIVDEVDGG